jgi:cytochrome P450
LYAVATLRFSEACRRRYGDVFTLRLVLRPRVVMVFEPALVKQLLQGSSTGSGNVEGHGDEPVLGSAGLSFPWHVERTVGGQSIVMLYGAAHSRRRRLLAPTLRAGRIRAMTTAITSATDRAVDSWPVGRPFALLPELQRLTFEATMAVLGFERDAIPPRLQHDIRKIRDAVVGPRRGGGLQSIRRLTRTADVSAHRQAVDEFVARVIERRRREGESESRDDFLSLLIAGSDGDGRGMSGEELRDDFVAMMVGADTPAVALTHAFELLMTHPSALARLDAELAVGDDTYLNAVVKETLRIRSPALDVSRVVVNAPYSLGDFVLPPGTELRVPIAPIHHARRIYTNPHEFRPERFLGSAPVSSASWLPFGGGARRCPGASLAEIEMAIVIRRVLERIRLTQPRTPGGRVRGLLSRNSQIAVGAIRVVAWPRPPARGGFEAARGAGDTHPAAR